MSVTNFFGLFEGNPVLVAARRERARVEQYEECPHCKKEIGEKEVYVPDMNEKVDDRIVSVHRVCGGRYISPPMTPKERADFEAFEKTWLR